MIVQSLLASKNFKIIFDQTAKDDYARLKQLCRCFKLFHTDAVYEPKGLYKGLLRSVNFV